VAAAGNLHLSIGQIVFKKSEVGYETVKTFSIDRWGVFSLCGCGLRDQY
jgi:hypothetical protein